ALSAKQCLSSSSGSLWPHARVNAYAHSSVLPARRDIKPVQQLETGCAACLRIQIPSAGRIPGSLRSRCSMSRSANALPLEKHATRPLNVEHLPDPSVPDLELC